MGEEGFHRLLAAERRRLALDVLAGGRPMGLEARAEAVPDRERQGDVSRNAVGRAAVDLYHRHLPLIAELGVVEFDRHERRVVGRRIEPEVR